MTAPAPSPTGELKLQSAAFWDQNPCGGTWNSYAAFMDFMQRTEPYIYSILDTYDWSGKQVLEVGCGQGSTANYLPQRGATVIALDMSLESLRQTRAGARELGHASRLIPARADAEHLPFPSESFDAVVSLGVLHHTADTAAAIREVHRLLKPGGTAIIMLYRTGNPKWWMTRAIRGMTRIADRLRGRQGAVADAVRARRSLDSSAGTSLLELFGVPILNAFSNEETRRMCAPFERVEISNHQPGFARLVDLTSWLR